MASKKSSWTGRVYTGKVDGKPTYQWCGRYPTRRERDAAVHEAKKRLGKRREKWTAEQWADRYLERYEREHKASSADTTRAALRRFKRDWGSRRLDSIARVEAMDWAEKVPAGVVAVVISSINAAVDAELLDRNPFRGLSKKGRGRSDQDPPTDEEFERLLAACDVLKEYGPHFRSLLVFASFTGMRPGEIFALAYDDIDIENSRVHVRRRVYKGHLDTPKSGKARTIALPPAARDAVLQASTNWIWGDNLAFRSIGGRRLSQPTMSQYWGKVKAAAGLDFDWYHATKHRCVHHYYVELGLPPNAVAAQMGWSLGSTISLLEVYSHHRVGALDAIDEAFAREVVPLRAVR